MTDDGPRVLTLDIETTPTRADVWGLFNQNVGLAQVHEPTRLLCFAAKWLGSDEVLFYSELKRDKMIQAAHNLISTADIVVTYNGDRFDLPHLNREFLEAGMAPPAPYQSVDLFKVVRKNFRFISNKLAHVTDQLDLTGKLSHSGHQLWNDVLAGDKDAWRIMRRYNKQDVVTTEELYLRLLPWIVNHPSVSLHVDDDNPRCPRCASEEIERRGFSYTRVGKFQRYQCRGCGGWSRGGKRISGVDVR